MRVAKISLFAMLVVSLAASTAVAQITAASLGYPKVPFGSWTNGGTYSKATGVFAVDSSATLVQWSNSPAPFGTLSSISVTQPALSIRIQVDVNGNLVGGNPTAGQPDFELRGTTTNGSSYATPLLQGTVTQFLWDSTDHTANFSFLVHPTGGSLLPQYAGAGNDVGVALVLENFSNHRVVDGATVDYVDFNDAAFTGNSKGILGSIPAPQCDITATKTCQLPPAPPPPFVCKNAKPIDSLTMIWNGSQPVRIKAWKNAKLNTDGTVNTSSATLLADIDNIAAGQTVTVSGYAAGTKPNNDQYWEVFEAGTNNYVSTLSPKSTFHLSCSDVNMNGPEDCGKAEGNGKTDGTTAAAGYINDWTFDGMAGNGQTLSCHPTAPPPAQQDCSFTKSNPSCKTSGKPTMLTFMYTGGDCSSGNNPQSGKAQCSGSVDTGAAITIAVTDPKYGKVNAKYAVNPASVNPGETFTVSASAFDADTFYTLSNAGGTEKLHIHTSCSQPLEVGDVFGNLTLVGFNGQTAGTTVTYNYTVSNNGSSAVTILGVDDKLGTIFNNVNVLGNGGSVTASQSATITDTTTNTFTVNSVGLPACQSQAQTTVTAVVPPLSCADGKPHALVFEYTGKDCSATNNFQNGKLICSGDAAPLPNGVQLVETDANASKFTISPSSLNVGDLVTVTFTSGTFPAQTPFAIKYNGNTVEALSIHTSCSQQLLVGDQFGTLRLVQYIP